MSKGLQAGAGKSLIQLPEELFPIESFGSVHDAPAVRVLLLKGGGNAAAIVAAELVMLHEEELLLVREETARQTGVPAKNVWVHATHAVSTPHPPHEAEPQKLYRRALEQAVEEAAAQAAASVQNAECRIGTADCDLACSRDIQTPKGWWIGAEGSGPSNPCLTAVQFVSESGQALAAFFSYGIKPAVLDNAGMEDGSRVVSSDLTGEACRHLEAQYRIPVLFLMSAAADQKPRRTALFDEVTAEGEIQSVDLGVAAGLKMAAEQGTVLAAAVREALESSAPLPDAEPALESAETEIVCPALERTKPRPGGGQDRVISGEKTVGIRVIRLGSLALVGCSPEINCATELGLQQASPFRYTLLVTVVDGGMKCMPDQSAFDRLTYEAQNTELAAGSAERFTEAAADILRQLAAP